ncbi:MAG: helix-turn-helix transcriptional regulator [Pseudomonadota bacterium]
MSDPREHPRLEDREERMAEKTIHPVDLHVGTRMRQRRRDIGITQEKLGDELDNPVTFQQIQKYEKGANRVGASRMWEISKVLEVPIAFFFDGFDETVAYDMPTKVRIETTPADEDFLRNYLSLNSNIRRQLRTLTIEIRKVDSAKDKADDQ